MQCPGRLHGRLMMSSWVWRRLAVVKAAMIENVALSTSRNIWLLLVEDSAFGLSGLGQRIVTMESAQDAI